MQGIIVLWSGAVVNIPSGWKLCDGNNYTPDLRDKFIIGAGGTYNPGDSASSNVATDSGLAYYSLCYIMKVP